MNAGRSVLLGAAILSCAPAPAEESVAAAAQPIVGGALDLEDDSVFWLEVVGDNNMRSFCTATLIDRRTLLTAAHCVDPWFLSMANSVSLSAVNLAKIVDPAERFQVVETRLHPDFKRTTLAADLALLLLDRSPEAASKPWSHEPKALNGAQLRAVGYGSTDLAGSAPMPPERRSVELMARELTATHITLGDLSSQGICHGDSGGPSFHTFDDGIERLVGVHSTTRNNSCVDGMDVRVDAYAGFISAWLAEKEIADCGSDGRCALGCAAVDRDCYCLSDGHCTELCDDLLLDPDCPRDCVANGVCSFRSCPRPDADCTPEGQSCRNPLECPGRRCIDDLKTPGAYCSRLCSAESDCVQSMHCAASGLCERGNPPAIYRAVIESSVPAVPQCATTRGGLLSALGWLIWRAVRSASSDRNTGS